MDSGVVGGEDDEDGEVEYASRGKRESKGGGLTGWLRAMDTSSREGLSDELPESVSG
jgi:hypothetical protein